MALRLGDGRDRLPDALSDLRVESGLARACPVSVRGGGRRQPRPLTGFDSVFLVRGGAPGGSPRPRRGGETQKAASLQRFRCRFRGSASSVPTVQRRSDSSHIFGTCDTASGPPNSVIVCISKEPALMKGVNKVILVGNLGKDPEIKFTPQGTQVAKFSVATSEKFKGKDGQWQERTEWHNITLWEGLAKTKRD